MLHDDITRQIIEAAIKVHTALGAGYRIDFLVENCVIVEIKAVEKLLPLHTAQLLSYLKLSGRKVGLLINFNVPHLRQGLRRIVNGYPLPQDSSSVSPVSSVVARLDEKKDPI
ncbi:MAG: GxxExxY protein [Acidobacteria bacterium]|nr:GxxExxY protein [Acidobacteriota bacterium]